MTFREQPVPNFFIVGAPKCGTTALYQFLEQHPEVFMPARKEPCFFGSDLQFHRQRSIERRDRARYLALFADATDAKAIGEASVRYLYSREAASEIRDFNPEARIIIMLRNPVDTMYSLHSQELYSGNEAIADFAEALAVETDRKQGKGPFPSTLNLRDALFYRDIVRFHDQVKRYLDVFGSDQVHIIIHDDFKLQPTLVYQDVLRFLQIDDTFVPRWNEVNTNKTYKSRVIARWLLWDPPHWLRCGARVLTTQKTRRHFARQIKRLNTRKVDRPPLAPELRRHLLSEFREEIDALSQLIGRDLSHWHAAPATPTTPTTPTTSTSPTPPVSPSPGPVHR